MDEVCVIGGGPSGSVFAARMAMLGHRVTLIERVTFPRRHLGESLSAGVLPLLDTIGAGDAVRAAGFAPVREVEVEWDGAEQVRRDPGARGLLVDRGRFDSVLLDRARALGVEVVQPARIVTRSHDGARWRVTIDAPGGPMAIQADYLAIATGRAPAKAGRRAPGERATLALYAYWRGAKPGRPRIEAGDAAWFWGVPLPDGSYNTLAFVDAAAFRAGGGSVEERFLVLLARSGLWPACRDAKLDGEVRAMDATARLDPDPVSDTSIRIGDAALAIDPISSSGVQKAIQSALSGAIVANTILARPASHAIAHTFYREHLREAGGRHRRWTAQHYATVAAVRGGAFWTARGARDATPADPVREPRVLAGDAWARTPVALSPDVTVADRPCIDDRFVTTQPTIAHPALDAPLAYLHGWPLAGLLARLRPGQTPLDCARAWSAAMPLQSALAIAAWLVKHHILVDHATGAARVPDDDRHRLMA